MTSAPRTLEDFRVGMHVHTPRFCDVEIDAVFSTFAEARRCGFNEDTHYGMVDSWGHYLPESLPVRVVGRTTGENRLSFAACPRRDLRGGERVTDADDIEREIEESEAGRGEDGRDGPPAPWLPSPRRGQQRLFGDPQRALFRRSKPFRKLFI